MNYLVYLSGTEIKAYTNVSPSAFEAFRLELAPQDILYWNDKHYPENVRPEIADVLPTFHKSMMRQWKGSATLIAPQPKKVEEETPVAAPKPKKTRKKKEKTNDK